MKVSLALFVAAMIGLWAMSGLGGATLILRNSLQNFHRVELAREGQSIVTDIKNNFSNVSNDLIDLLLLQVRENDFEQAVFSSDKLSALEMLLFISARELPIQSRKIYINRGSEIAWVNNISGFLNKSISNLLIEKIESLAVDNVGQFIVVQIDDKPVQLFVISIAISTPGSFEVQGHLRAVFDFGDDSPVLNEILLRSSAACMAVIGKGNLNSVTGDPECTANMLEVMPDMLQSEDSEFLLDSEYLWASDTYLTDYPFDEIRFVVGQRSEIMQVQSSQLAYMLAYLGAALAIAGLFSVLLAAWMTRRSVKGILTFIEQDVSSPPQAFMGSHIREMCQIASAHQRVREELIVEMSNRESAEDNIQILNSKLKTAHSDKMEALGTLTAGVAHDFNNILGIILGNAEIMKLELSSQSKPDTRIEQIIEASNRAASLVSDLLLHVRNDVHQMAVYDLAEILRNLSTMMQSSLGPQIDLKLEVAGGRSEKFWVNIDSDRCATAIINLVTNARDAMSNGGTLTIRLRRENPENINERIEQAKHGCCVLELTDTGNGISDDDLRQIFVPFYTTKPKSEGVGLGLYLVHSFVEQSAGKVDVYSELHRGTSFKLMLPLQTPPPNQMPNESKTTGSRLDGLRILVVDDEPSLRSVLKNGLTMVGADVTTVESVVNASELINKHCANYFDAIVSDMLLADGLGINLEEMVGRNIERTKLVYISGYSSLEEIDEMAASKDRKRAFMPKPFKLVELIELLQSITSDSRSILSRTVS